MKYKTVVLDFETTGLDADNNEILQVSVIDQDNNTLLNEYCKPKILKSWEEAEAIHKISPSFVKDKKPFEEYVDILSEILTNTETIVIYNANFEISFLEKYNVKFNKNIYDLMYAFAEVYGEWNDYWQSYTWKSLSVCCNYYGYFLGEAHNSLEDSKATLYCYNKLINGEKEYTGEEFLGKTLKEFLDINFKKVNEGIELTIMPSETETASMGSYQYDVINNYSDLKYKELLQCKIKEINYINPVKFKIRVSNILQGDLDIFKEKYKSLQNSMNKKVEALEKRNDNYFKLYRENSILYNNEKKRTEKLEKQINRMKEKLGLILKKRKQIYMFNGYGFYTAEYCKSTKKPMFKSFSEYRPFADKLLSATKCKKIKRPVQENEEIYAFYKVMHGYCALYFRDNDLDKEIER